MLRKKLTKPSLILVSECMLIFVKVKKDTYTFFFFLLLNQFISMLCAESYSNLRNGRKTSLILQLSQDSEACPRIHPQLVFYLTCCQNINMQMTYNERIKMNFFFHSNQQTKPKLSSSELFSSLGKHGWPHQWKHQY